MSLGLSRYNVIRERIFFLYNILNNRLYKVMVTPTMMMSIDEMRDRPQYYQEDFVNDTTYYEDYQERDLTIPKIIDILPNMVSERQLGFRDANSAVIEIYESIQEYIQLWCELVNKAPEFNMPPLDELRNLELLAYTIFDDYKSIKGYIDTKHLYAKVKDEEEANKRNLAGLRFLLSLTSMNSGKEPEDGIVFISHLDDFQGAGYHQASSTLNDHPIIAKKAVVDSLSSPESSIHNLGDWTFKG